MAGCTLATLLASQTSEDGEAATITVSTFLLFLASRHSGLLRGKPGRAEIALAGCLAACGSRHAASGARRSKTQQQPWRAQGQAQIAGPAPSRGL
jgi:hypothetical protein